jgi:hypothetical protein
MSRRQQFFSLVGLGLPLAMGACSSPNFGNTCPIPVNADNAARTAAIKKCFGRSV